MNERPAARLAALGSLLVALAGCAGPAHVAGPAAREAMLAHVSGRPAAPGSALASPSGGAREVAPATHMDPDPAAGLRPNALAELAAPVERPAGEAETCRADPRGWPRLGAGDPATPGEIVLTFDDGPHPTGTPRVLDLLREHHMPATFFVVGRVISRDTYPIVQRIVAEGHTIGTHSYSHDVHMTRVGAPEATHADIVGQHTVTRILVDLALLATSPDDFDAMFVEVFRSPPDRWLSKATIRREHEAFSARHAALLAGRGFAPGARPHDVVLSRPPGGGPYVEHDGAAGVALHDAALAELGLVNVMWHDASDDTVPKLRSDFAFLTANIARAADRGGVVLLHDYIRGDALAHALAALASRDDVRVVPIDEALRHKFGCGAAALAASAGGDGPAPRVAAR
jgi:peptidoglycan/xylan/chitin deacetylase (PgdA/CDA1 family)